MQVAYRRALARSADPARLRRQQARWQARVQAAPNRAAIARLYRVRLRELTARPQRLYPPPVATLWRADVGADPEMPPY